jgi:hypothetical protein
VDQSRKLTWQPITALPLVAAAITGMLEGTPEQHRLLIEARQRPYVLDDHTVAPSSRIRTACLLSMKMVGESWRPRERGADRRRKYLD